MDYEYIDSPEALLHVVERLRRAPILGVDTEAAGYHRYHDRISLMQISSRDENFLIDPLAIDDFSPLRPLLEETSAEKIFHDADFDLRILHRDLQIHVRRLFDTQIAAAFVGERSLGLGAIVEKYLGINLPKEYQRADWAERPLSEGMKEYAATDTAYLPPLRDRLLEELERLGRVAWADEEFARREGTRWSEPQEPVAPFLRIKGARDLTPRGLAILRELHGWRESVGAERDQATFRVLSNQALLEMSAKAPTNEAALGEIKGVSSGLINRRGGDLIDAVRRGLNAPEDQLPSFPPSRRWDRDQEAEERSERLRRVRNQIAEDLDLDAGFLMSRAVLDEIARRNPRSLEELEDVPEVRHWQVEVMGGQLLQAVRG